MFELDEVTILAVDDVAENLVALRMLLKRPGIRLVEAHSGYEALEALLVHDVALALVDVNMPGMDGFELAELMRGTERTRHVPIIFLTASTPDRNRIFKGYDAGAVDFLFKPIDPRLLSTKVDVFAQLHRQKRQLATQLEQIQQAQRMSDLFVGVLGHDLRNPLNSILTSATLLERAPDDAEGTKQKARIIQRGSRRMAALIQQVLDFALARVKGRLPVEPKDANLSQITRHVVSEFGETAERVRIDIVGDVAGRWDIDRMMQLASNLLGNAFEHGDPSSPIQIRIDGSDDGWVHFEVRNGGLIPPEKVETLFLPFKPREGNSRGVGLGLYIVDQIARAHQGSVVVASDEVAGTSFRVTVPRHVAETPTSAPPSSTHGSGGSG